jgi:hypothetical protein
MPVVGFLHAGSPEPMANIVAAFRKGLNETVYIEGQQATKFELVVILQTAKTLGSHHPTDAARPRRRGDRMTRRELFVSFLSPSNRHFLH